MSKKIKALQTLGLIAGTTVAVGCLGVAGYAIADGAITLPTQAETPTVTPPQDVSTVVTDASITVALIANAEYSLDGKTWQDSNIFLGLQPAQEYTVYIRIKATEGTPASEPTTVQVTTDKSVQAAPQINAPETTADSIIFEQITGLEFSINNGDTWQNSNIFNNLQPAQEYTVLVRYAETATKYASDTVSFIVSTTKAEQLLVPDIDAAEEITADSITLPAISGVEYSINNSTWQTSNIFNNLQPATEYTIYMRYAETDTTFVGETVTILVTTSVDALPYTVASIDEEAKTVTISTYTGDATELVVPAKMSVQNVNGTNYAVEGTAYDVIVDRYAFRDTQLVTLDLSAITTPCSFVGEEHNKYPTYVSYTDYCFPETLKSITFPKQVSGIGTSDLSGDYYSAPSGSVGTSATSHKGAKNAFQKYLSFYYSTAIEEINIAGGVGDYFASKDGVLYSADFSVLLYCPVNTKLNNLTIPEGCTKIADYAFDGITNKISNIKLADSVEFIGYRAFTNSCVNLQFADNSNLKTIEQYGLYTEATNLILPEGLITFSGQDLPNVEKLYIPETVTTCGASYYMNALKEIEDRSGNFFSQNLYVTGSNVTTIKVSGGNLGTCYKFVDCLPNLETIQLNANFKDNNFLRSLATIYSWGDYQYNIIVENGTVKIEDGLLIFNDKIVAVLNNNSGIVTLPNDYDTVDHLYNLNATIINEIIIPSNIKTITCIYIAYSVFSDVTTLTFESATPIDLPTQILNRENITTYYVPNEAVETYKTAWTSVADKIKPISEKPTTE